MHTHSSACARSNDVVIGQLNRSIGDFDSSQSDVSKPHLTHEGRAALRTAVIAKYGVTSPLVSSMVAATAPLPLLKAAGSHHAAPLRSARARLPASGLLESG